MTRAQSGAIAVWPLALPDPLPTIPIPLRSPDADVPLNLGSALHSIYDEAAYDLSIDYSAAPPPPPLSSELQAWLETCVATVGGST